MAEDKLENARQQGQAQFDSIREMVEAYQTDDPRAAELATETIQNDALEVLIRSDWHSPGKPSEEGGEYQILLCTGGPACRIVGELDEHNEPKTAVMEVQDWFTPWTAIRPSADVMTSKDAEEIMLAYARCFWFGE